MRIRGFMAVGGLALMGLAAGCGTPSASTKLSVHTVIASAATKSASAATFHLSLTGTEQADGVTMQVSMSGDFDLSSQRASATMHSAGLGRSSSTTSGVGSGTLPSNWTMSLIQVGNQSWFKGSFFGTGDKWLLNDGSDSGLARFPNPSKLFSQLSSGATSVKFLGTASVDAANTDHYEMSVPTAFFDNLGGNSSDGTTAEPGSTSVQVWVDRSDLIRRLSATMNDPSGPISFTMDFTNYGQPVNIQAPPPSQVTTMGNIIPGVTVNNSGTG